MKFEQVICVLLVIIGYSSCKKAKEDFLLTTNLNVVNAALNVGIKVDPGRGFIYANDSSIKYGVARSYALARTSIPFKIVNAADTTATLYDNVVELRSANYTMFIAGVAPTPQVIINEETNFPFIPQDKIYTSSDSVVNVRFVNLSPNSTPVKIKIASATTNEVDNLPFGSIGNWKAYPALLATTTYSFQIRDAGTDALITTYSFIANSTNRFKNVALVIKGLEGTTAGTNAFGVFVVNYF